MKETDLSYIAGFFDGEGSISLLKRERLYRKLTTTYFLRVSIGQKDGTTLDWIKELLGGNNYEVKRDGSFTWVATDKKAYEFLITIVKYLRYKKPQAVIGIEFYEKFVLPRKSHGKRTELSLEELLEREKYFLEMKRLKKVFTKSTHVKSSNND